MTQRYREIGGTEPQKFLPHVERMCSSIWRAPKMLHDLHGELASRGIAFQIVGVRASPR
jgi:hypothetical protein